MAKTKKQYVPSAGDKIKFTNAKGLTRIGSFVDFHIPELSNPNGIWSYYQVEIDGAILKGYSLNQIQPVKSRKS